MKAQWKIVPVKSSAPIGYKWRWIKARDGKIVEECREGFGYYYDCLLDARKHGFHACQINTAPIMMPSSTFGLRSI